MACTATRAVEAVQQGIFEIWWNGTFDHGCAAAPPPQKKERTAWCYIINITLDLLRMFSVPCIYVVKS